jgi:hypothetical protein
LPAIQVTHRAAITESVRVGQLLRDIHSYQGTFVVTRALRLSALLMVRPGELRQAEWKDFYLNDAEWGYFVTKTETEHTVPLSKQSCRSSRINRVKIVMFSPVSEMMDDQCQKIQSDRL